VLHVHLISWVDVRQLLTAIWPPSVSANQVLVEYFLGINLDESSIPIVGDPSTIISSCNQISNCWPWKWSSLVVGFILGLSINLLTHVDGKQVFTDVVVRVIESVLDIPAQGLEFLSLDQDGVEPAQTEHGLSEVSVLFDNCEFSLLTVESQHVCFDSFWWLLGNLGRSLQKRN
jgi:hypothetical protein